MLPEQPHARQQPVSDRKAPKAKRTEEHASMEVSLARGTFSEVHYRTVLAAPFRITLQCKCNTCCLRYLRCKW